MTSEIEILEYILKRSIERNGNQPLTTQHLLNIVSMVRRESLTEKAEQDSYDLAAEFSDPNL